MKKLFASILASLLFVSCFTCMAAEAPEEKFDKDTKAALAEAELYAYLDVDSASPAMKEKILDARNTIIFSKDWVADGHDGYVIDVETDQILETLPSFSSLFPDWDLPVDNSTSPSVSLNPPFLPASLAPKSASSWLRLASKNYYLPSASNSHDASPFITFIVNSFDMGTSIRSYATALTSSKNYNIGYKNASTGKSLGYKNNLTLNQAFAINNVGGMNLAIRASTYSIPGYATMAVDGANRIINTK